MYSMSRLPYLTNEKIFCILTIMITSICIYTSVLNVRSQNLTLIERYHFACFFLFLLS